MFIKYIYYCIDIIVIIILFCVFKYNILFCVFVCMTGYRLDPWTSYKHETGIIRTSRTWGCATWTIFSRKVTSGQITKQKFYAINAFLWENYIYIYSVHFDGPLLVIIKIEISYDFREPNKTKYLLLRPKPNWIQSKKLSPIPTKTANFCQKPNPNAI